MTRRRLDVALVEDGHCETRSRAQAAVLAGIVRVDGVVAQKAGASVAPDSRIEMDTPQEFVSRGGTKLANALDAVDMDVRGVHAIDLGASTGGFTDCLLQRGAESVIAVDVGYGQLDYRLRQDPRVHVLERTNARHLTPKQLPYGPDLVVCDVSFISIRLVWPAVRACLPPGWRGLLMVKPQFEVGREQVGRGGVVRDPELRAQAVTNVAECVLSHGGAVLDAADSGLSGPKGNREVFLVVGDAATATTLPTLDRRIQEAVHVA
ncbi:MAG: TlyA family RNA methyltransferase [Thermoleophilia bacterium]|nr:TlyA family RNA methyltransferase [Thermoleophilia bacterium]